MPRIAKLSSHQSSQLRSTLLAWYDQNRRDLPWRRTRDPYRIWVSEIMLQQTRVAAVLPRYERFLIKFPTVEKLASARLAAVLAEWSGLGYYHRARNLHAAAKVIVQNRGGQFPVTARELRELPGIGRYTAAAIASIAFNEPVAVVDGNVERVLFRMVKTRGKLGVWNIAQQLIDRARPAEFNQAMMELGATVCLPGEPECGKCPIRRFCRTRGRGQPRKSKPRQKKTAAFYGLATRPKAVFLVQRSNYESLMPGMWELPKLDTPHAENHGLFRVRHSITITDYIVTVVQSTQTDVAQGKWVRISRINDLPLTGLTKKILRKAKIIV